MIYIYATGSNDKRMSMAEDACAFFVKRLMPRLKKLDITIECISDLKKTEGIWGDCTWEDTNHSPRAFTIRLDSSVSYKNMIDTLAHEVVHVKQYVRGELVDLVREPQAVKWRGKIVKWSNTSDEPWEIEPEEVSTKLYREWVSYK